MCSFGMDSSGVQPAFLLTPLEKEREWIDCVGDRAALGDASPGTLPRNKLVKTDVHAPYNERG